MKQAVEIEIFETQRGACPFLRWLDRLATSTRVRIMTHVDRLSLGNFGASKSLGGGLHEIRVHYGPGYRVYYGKKCDRVVILLCGGDKGSQKRDIKKAKEYWEGMQSKLLEKGK